MLISICKYFAKNDNFEVRNVLNPIKTKSFVRLFRKNFSKRLTVTKVMF